MPYANYNQNVKVYIFVQDHIQVGVVVDFEQQITLQLNFQDGQQIVTTIVYAKCVAAKRVELWDDIYLLSQDMRFSWLVEGDFNVIMSDEEKIGSFPVYPNKYEDFAFYINSCKLVDINFKGSHFTWWNGRTDNACIFKRLDGLVMNQEFLGLMGCVEMEHLARTGSDHAPLLLFCGGQSAHYSKPFKENFKKVVAHNWVSEVTEDIFVNLKQKMKKTKLALSCWSKERFGDIFKQLKIREDIARVKEDLFVEFPTAANRYILMRAQAELK